MTPFMRYIPTYVRMYVCKRGRGECLEHNVHLFTLPSARTLPFFAQTSSLSLSFKAFPIDCHIPYCASTSPVQSPTPSFRLSNRTHYHYLLTISDVMQFFSEMI